jgi:hypothetical protein
MCGAVWVITQWLHPEIPPVLSQICDAMLSHWAQVPIQNQGELFFRLVQYIVPLVSMFYVCHCPFVSTVISMFLIWGPVETPKKKIVTCCKIIWTPLMLKRTPTNLAIPTRWCPIVSWLSWFIIPTIWA